MLVSTPARTIPRFDRIALAQTASAAPARAAGVVPRAAVGLLYVFLEDACLLLAVVICVREPSQNSAAGHALAASVKARTLRRAVYVEGTITSISRYAAWIITAPSAISRLDLGAFSEPAATAAVERADEALLYARLGLPIVIANVKPA